MNTTEAMLPILNGTFEAAAARLDAWEKREQADASEWTTCELLEAVDEALHAMKGKATAEVRTLLASAREEFARVHDLPLNSE